MISSHLDAINALFQLAGAVATWNNVNKLMDDRLVRGVQLSSVVFFSVWGFWNVLYFWQLDQWLSVVSGVALAAGNAVWASLALWYRRGYGKDWL